MIRPATTSDFSSILEINLEWEHYLSPLDLDRLLKLNRLADQLWVVEDSENIEDKGRVGAFLLVFREGTEYDSLNYRWFSDRLDQFYYVDRIAIRREFQGKGIGKQLYEKLFEIAERERVNKICCEYNLIPLNAGSKIFHLKMGFQEIGRQELKGDKVVSLQEKLL